jgi:hypothetical protein
MAAKKSSKSRQMVFNQKPIDSSGAFFMSGTSGHSKRKKETPKKFKQDNLFAKPFRIPDRTPPKMKMVDFVDARHISESELKAKKNTKLNSF